MDADAEAATYAVTMEVRQWLLIDGTLDNEISTEAQNGDLRNVIDLATSIRQAGWDHHPDWPHTIEGFRQWPRPGQQTTMTLTGAQWQLVVASLDRWSAVAASLGERGEPEFTVAAENERAIADLVRTQLAEQGWSPASK